MTAKPCCLAENQKFSLLCYLKSPSLISFYDSFYIYVIYDTIALILEIKHHLGPSEPPEFTILIVVPPPL